MRFSVITPTFNRRDVVRRALDSGLQFVRAVGDSEIVVIDDASKDGTVDVLREHYPREISDGLIKLITREKNGGSTVAKTDGARKAIGDWLVFLDSDDELLPDAATHIPDFIDTHGDAKLFFFRCVDHNDQLVGPQKLPARLSFNDLLNKGTPGECMPVASRIAVLQFPSNNDPLAYEFMQLLRIARAYGGAVLSDSIVRRYHTEGDDRLTSFAGNLRRAPRHAQGFEKMLREFGPAMSPEQRRRILLRIFCYRAIAATGIPRIV